jgi:nicotinate-nucleotide adenylyltransferase
MQGIGMFGGSFDPVHLGHLLVAQAAREELGLARLFFIPTAQSPFKPERQPTPANERLQLLRLALAGESWCEIDDQEIKRGGVSYSIDTVRDYARRFPEAQLCWLIGADHVAQLPMWQEAEALARLVEFVVIPRPGRGNTEAECTSFVHKHESLAGAKPAPADGPVPAPFRGRILSGFPFGVSSSQIRGRVKVGLSINHLVPTAVAEAIKNNRLYL